MLLKVLASSSAGNCYIMQASDGDCLVLECGVPFMEVKKAINFNISKITSVCITHQHLDHCKYAKDAIRAGITVNCLKETADAIGINGHRTNHIVPGKAFNSRYFKILPFSLQHDVACVGFLIQHPESGTVLFLTDTYYSAYKFTGLNNIIIEANYDSEILHDRMKNGSTVPFLRDRVLKSHMSLETTKELLRCNDLSEVNNIVLVHLSDAHSDAEMFQKEVEEMTGKNVWIADKGMEISLNKTPI